MNIKRYIPTYEEAVELSSFSMSPFYETKLVVDGYNVSLFNYRLANYGDFKNPLPGKEGFEMRGLTFVFNTDGSLYKRYILLHKFFNLNQTEDSLYSEVKDLKIKTIQNKEDGSIASFVKLPNGRVVGKTKMGFDNLQSEAINRIYNSNKELKKFVNWSLDNDIVSIFEYVSPSNRIVLKYNKEELILLKLRCNKTGKYLNMPDYTFQIGNLKVAEFEMSTTLDDVLKLNETEIDKEGRVIHFEGDHFVKVKNNWYVSLHGLLTEDIYKENVIISNILDDKIDDIIGQIPQDDTYTHNRINKIISIVKKSVNDKVSEINDAYLHFVNLGISKKDYAINYRIDNDNFVFVMNMIKHNELKSLSEKEVIDIYKDYDSYEKSLIRTDVWEMAKEFIRDKTKRLLIARDWLKEKDDNLFFIDLEGDN
jgi:T4 RnlA family RNA ligase